MRAWHVVPLLALTLAASGCYTTVVDTGREPSRHRVRDEWVMGFASGLLMVERVDAERLCANGVARVKTETSFPNFLVQTFTAGLLSPRTVEVTCAAGPGEPVRWATREIHLDIRHDLEHEHEFQHEFEHELEHEFEHQLQHELDHDLRVEIERGFEYGRRHPERAERGRVRIRVRGEQHVH